MRLTCLNVCIYVDELHALFKAPEHTLGTFEKCLEEVDERPVAALLLPVLHLVLQVLEHDPDHLDDGDDEAAKGGGAQVKAQEAIEGAHDGAHSHTALVPETLICLSSIVQFCFNHATIINQTSKGPFSKFLQGNHSPHTPL